MTEKLAKFGTDEEIEKTENKKQPNWLRKKGLEFLLTSLILFNQVKTSLAQDYNPDVSLKLINRPAITQAQTETSGESNETAEARESTEYFIYPGVSAKTSGLSVEINIDQNKFKEDEEIQIVFAEYNHYLTNTTITSESIEPEYELPSVLISDNKILYRVNPDHLATDADGNYFTEITGSNEDGLRFKSEKIFLNIDHIEKHGDFTIAIGDIPKIDSKLKNQLLKTISEYCDNVNKQIKINRPNEYDQYKIQSIALFQPTEEQPMHTLESSRYEPTSNFISSNSEFMKTPDLLLETILHEANHALYRSLSKEAKEKIGDQYQLVRYIQIKEIESNKKNNIFELIKEGTYFQTLHPSIESGGHPYDNPNEFFTSSVTCFLFHRNQLEQAILDYECESYEKQTIVLAINKCLEIAGIEDKLDITQLVIPPRP